MDHIWAGSRPLKDSGSSNVLGAAAAADPACGEESKSYPKAESGSGMEPADGKQHTSYVQALLAARVRRLYKERLQLSSRTAFRRGKQLRDEARIRGVSLAKVKSRLARRSHCFCTGQYVLSPEWRRNVLDWAGAEFVPMCEPWDRPTRVRFHKGEKRREKRGFYIPWGNETLFLHPLATDSKMAVEKVVWDGSRGIAVVPVLKRESWFWALGEIAVDWWDLPPGELLFEDRWGVLHPQERNSCTRVVIVDALGRHQDGMNVTDWKKPASRKLSQSVPVAGRPKRPVGQPREVWRAKVEQLARDGQLPLPICADILPSSVAAVDAVSHKGQVPISSSSLLQDSDRKASVSPPVHVCATVIPDVTTLSEMLPLPTDTPPPVICTTDLHNLAEGCLADHARPPLTVAAIESEEVYDSVVASPSLPDTQSLYHTVGNPKEKKNCQISDWIDNATAATVLRRFQFSELSPPQQLFHARDRCIQSVIEADGEIRECQQWRDKLLKKFGNSVFRRDGNTYKEIEAHAAKRGPHGWCKLELLPDSEPRACKAIRVVGIREQVLGDKVREFMAKGWIRESRSNWVARGFLVRKPGVNKWRLVIDYRYLNSCLKGHEFPLPVIEDTLCGQAGNHLSTLLDLEDGFHQMPLEESSRHLTAFCTPFGVYEWNVPPMGVKVGPAAFQRMVSWCLAHHQVLGAKAYIDDILIGTAPHLRGKGKLLDRHAFEEHYIQVRALLRALADCHLQVRPEKCHMFMGRVKYCGHILEGGMRKPAPSKVAAIKESTESMITTPKQMKEFLGVCNWYSIYIPNYAALAAPLMDSLHGKYSHVRAKPGGGKGRCVVKKEDNFITWTPLMRDNFARLKDAICEKTALYIPTADGEYAIHVDASDFGVGAVLEQQNEQGQGVPCAFFSRKLEKGQRLWGVREKETYGFVSCLLNCKSWIGGRKVTVFTDHKSLESWYKEDLCTMAGPLGRRGHWHEFLSRYNIVVVYKPGADNVIADGLSRWAYPAGVADDTNFHGSDADLEGLMRWEAKEREWELDQLSDTAIVDPGANIQAMRAQFAADKRVCRVHRPQHLFFVHCMLQHGYKTINTTCLVCLPHPLLMYCLPLLCLLPHVCLSTLI